MSEWNYTKCSKPFESVEQARNYMVERGFGGQILQRDHGGYTAVCPTYPEGYYPDAVVVETVEERPQPEAESLLAVRDVSAQSECCGELAGEPHN